MKNRQETFALLRERALIAFSACALILSSFSQSSAQARNSPKTSPPAPPAPVQPISNEVMLKIVRAEDERRYDNDLGILIFDKDQRVRERAALAAGRIGDERAVASLVTLLQTDKEASVRARAAFALGETESVTGASALSEVAQKANEASEVRARAVEALGKIAAALPKTDEAHARTLGELILKTLDDDSRSSKPNRELILLELTATLRARPAGAGLVVAKFLSSTDARVRADAENTLTRLRAKDATAQLRQLLANDPDAVVRANAARALGVAEDAASLDALAARVANDKDERVRVSAIRALGALKDARAAAPLLQRADALMPAYKSAKTNAAAHPAETNELLEIATSLGLILANRTDERAINWLRSLRETEQNAPEIEIAFAHIAPFVYVREAPFNRLSD